MISRVILGHDPGAAVAAPRLPCKTIEPALLESAAGADGCAALRTRSRAVLEVPRNPGYAYGIARSDDP